MAFKKFDEAYHGLGPTFDTDVNSTKNIVYPDPQKLESFVDDIRYLCKSYGYHLNHEVDYQSMESPSTWETIVSAIMTMRITAR